MTGWSTVGVSCILVLLCSHIMTRCCLEVSDLDYFAYASNKMVVIKNVTMLSTSRSTLSQCAKTCRENNRPFDINNSNHNETGYGNTSLTCDAFEYVEEAGVCILLNTCEKSGGRSMFSELRPAVGTNYYEMPKPAESLFTQIPGHALTGDHDYHRLLNVTSSEQCAHACAESPGLTCNSFAYSPSQKLCALSRYTVDKNHVLMATDKYDYYQYSGDWPCNVTIPWNYSPKTIATFDYPFYPRESRDCYVILEPPAGKRVILTIMALYGHHTLCDDENTGIFIYGGVEGPLRVCENVIDSGLEINGEVDRNMTVTMVQGKSNFVARMTYGYETPARMCQEDHCLNGATCHVTEDLVTCSCPRGHTGQRCETEIDNCSSRPCLFDGQCLNGDEGYACECLPGTKGNNCEIFIGDCHKRPCKNGICTPALSSSGYSCACDEGYTGSDCEYDINECFSSPCLNGECVDGINGYNCTCREGFSGSNCQIRTGSSNCNPHYCKFGTCALNQSGSYCQCFPGFKGENCDVNINECKHSPCAHGTCIDHVNGFICNCSHGYKGKHCDILSNDPCNNNKCINGYCSIIDGGHQCICNPGFTGEVCSEATKIASRPTTLFVWNTSPIPLTINGKINATTASSSNNSRTTKDSINTAKTSIGSSYKRTTNSTPLQSARHNLPTDSATVTPSNAGTKVDTITTSSISSGGTNPMEGITYHQTDRTSSVREVTTLLYGTNPSYNTNSISKTSHGGETLGNSSPIDFNVGHTESETIYGRLSPTPTKQTHSNGGVTHKGNVYAPMDRTTKVTAKTTTRTSISTLTNNGHSDSPTIGTAIGTQMKATPISNIIYTVSPTSTTTMHVIDNDNNDTTTAGITRNVEKSSTGSEFPQTSPSSTRSASTSIHVNGQANIPNVTYATSHSVHSQITPGTWLHGFPMSTITNTKFGSTVTKVNTQRHDTISVTIPTAWHDKYPTITGTHIVPSFTPDGHSKIPTVTETTVMSPLTALRTIAVSTLENVTTARSTVPSNHEKGSAPTRVMSMTTHSNDPDVFPGDIPAVEVDENAIETDGHVITVESILIGALAASLLAVIGVSVTLLYRRSRSGAVYISSTSHGRRRKDRDQSTAVKKRLSSRDIYSELKQGRFLHNPSYSLTDVRTDGDSHIRNKKPSSSPSSSSSCGFSSSPGSPKSSSSSSRTDQYEPIETKPHVMSTSQSEASFGSRGTISGFNQRRHVTNVGMMTPTVSNGPNRPNIKATASNMPTNQACIPRLDPFVQRDDGTVGLNLKNSNKRITQDEFQTMFDHFMTQGNLLQPTKPGKRRSVHHISGAENGRSDA